MIFASKMWFTSGINFDVCQMFVEDLERLSKSYFKGTMQEYR